MKNKQQILSAMLALTSAALIGTTQAATVTAPLDVSATVNAVCFVSTAPVDFGVHTNASNTTEGGVTVKCSPKVAYNIAMDAGLNYFNDRRLTDGLGNFIIYGLHKVGTWNVFWGDTDYAATAKGTSLAGAGTGSNQAHIVYGYSNYSGFPLMAPGAYNDTVTVTVHY